MQFDAFASSLGKVGAFGNVNMTLSVCADVLGGNDIDLAIIYIGDSLHIMGFSHHHGPAIDQGVQNSCSESKIICGLCDQNGVVTVLQLNRIL